MHKLNIKTMVLGPISTNTYICTITQSGTGCDTQSVTEGVQSADCGTTHTDNGVPLYKAAGCFIIDPASNAPAIIKALGDITPDAILLTHGHFDHLMAVNELREKYPGIKVYAHPGDTEIMLHPGKNIILRELTDHAVTSFVPVDDGQILNIGGAHIEVISTPGHTKGGVCYYIGDNKVLFSGDTLFRESYGRTDFESGDFEELKDSIVNKLFPRLRKEGHVDILPGHMEATDLEHEMKYNPIVTGDGST